MKITCIILLTFIILLLEKIHKLKKTIKEERESYLKTLNHDLKVATIAQIRALELLHKISNNEQKNFVYDIKNSCKYSLDMIITLLLTYKFKNGEQVLNYTRFNLDEMITECFENTKKLCHENNNITFCLNSTNDNTIIADKELLTKLFNILYMTSIINSEDKETISTIIKKQKKHLLITITYTGKPLSEEEYKRMFSNKPCYTTVGHGIRMYLCKKIVDFHNGNINVNNNTNINLFKIELPITNSHKQKINNFCNLIKI